MSGIIDYRVTGGVAELVLNNPEKRNAISQAMWQSMPGLVAQANDDAAVTALIIHGGATGAFAAGADISEFETIYATPEAAARSSAHIANGLSAIERSEKPVMAAIEGACVGGGVSIAMACDIRIAGDGAKFGVTPGKLGLCYPVADTRRLIQAVGPSATRDILYTGRIFPAEEAARIGLIDQLVGRDEALHHAREKAQTMAGNSQWSIQATKHIIARLLAGAEDDDAEAGAIYLSAFDEDDFHEGYRAFLEKRAPDFSWRG